MKLGELCSLLRRIKPLDPVGFNAAFFRKNWEVVGSDVIMVVQSFFFTVFLLQDWNATTLTLVPKTRCPFPINDYRPIAYQDFIMSDATCCTRHH